jgi:WD40 repeat protein
MATAARELGSPCAAAVFAGAAPLFALADGSVHSWATGQSARVHPALLAAVPTVDRALLTAGEDGRVCRTTGKGESTEIASVPRKWIVSVAADRAGTTAFAVGRSVWLHDVAGRRREFEFARGVTAVRLAPDGTQLAVSRYGGMTVHTLVGDSPPLDLEWKGICAAIDFSPDARFLLAFMQDGLLHGWRLPVGRELARHFRMTGYTSKVKDWSWTDDGRWLATSGAASVVLWPFAGVEGPIGATALEVGDPRGDALVTAVACRPGGEAVAIGYDDGAVLVASIRAEAERLVRNPGGAPVLALAWHGSGSSLAFGTASGACGVLDVPN